LVGIVVGAGAYYGISNLPARTVTETTVSTTTILSTVTSTVTSTNTSPVYARIDTSMGSFEVELFPACAPKTVANFVSLAQSGFYDDLVWHRIITSFVIQTGDPNTRGGLNSTRATWGQGGSNNTVPLEVGICSWIGNYEGYLGMARGPGIDSGTSQFYINLSNSTSNLDLNGYYTVFGKVVSGMSVVLTIGDAPVCQQSTCPSTWPADEPLPAVFVNDVVILDAA